MHTYRIKGRIRSQAASAEFVQRAESDVQDLRHRSDSQVYFRTIDRQLQNDMGEQSRWGDADKYDHTRKLPIVRKFSEKEKEMSRE